MPTRRMPKRSSRPWADCGPHVAKVLVWDNAPPHQPKLMRQAAEAAHITRTFLPFRTPEINPGEDLWPQLKRVVAAHRGYASMEDLLERTLALARRPHPSRGLPSIRPGFFQVQ